MGRTAIVSSRISSSFVKTLPHVLLPTVVNASPINEPTNANPIATTAASRAFLGRPAPSSWPTLVETAALRAIGNVYISEVVWITMPEVASAIRGL
ncbi:hypothetical protein IC575_027132 [Cucumis melo]